jgi:hypothetical protein
MCRDATAGAANLRGCSSAQPSMSFVANGTAGVGDHADWRVTNVQRRHLADDPVGLRHHVRTGTGDADPHESRMTPQASRDASRNALT